MNNNETPKPTDVCKHCSSSNRRLWRLNLETDLQKSSNWKMPWFAKAVLEIRFMNLIKVNRKFAVVLPRHFCQWWITALDHLLQLLTDLFWSHRSHHTYETDSGWREDGPSNKIQMILWLQKIAGTGSNEELSNSTTTRKHLSREPWLSIRKTMVDVEPLNCRPAKLLSLPCP